ncbi:thiamine phosphate synthase [Phytohabitans sp. ZYX-F-186]|uniref:Thiamine phosphate synthase n=1 Tax=Phytohabitans maris TaxID=3071409 RepID=A0ABU0Z8M9_9ACTN|nr:thiamine phosphate synthase [Phytohabitans sp. ZYX-F-186]MDQ7903353.1 thiamine phosphate synthase [Phytohabitans sp. ZYX-F-186]
MRPELSGVVVLTDRRTARRPLAETVAASVEGGARCVVLREKDMPPDERAALAEALRAVLADVGGLLVVAGPDPLGGDAVHLPAAGPYPPPDLPLVGRSCHDEAELSRLSRERYAMVSPVFPTPSKPGYGPPLGLGGLARLVSRSPVPLLALGGITPGNAASCLAAGAAGVAVMGAVMRADDPAAVVRDLLSATLSVKTPAGRGGVWS